MFTIKLYGFLLIVFIITEHFVPSPAAPDSSSSKEGKSRKGKEISNESSSSSSSRRVRKSSKSQKLNPFDSFLLQIKNMNPSLIYYQWISDNFDQFSLEELVTVFHMNTNFSGAVFQYFGENFVIPIHAKEGNLFDASSDSNVTINCFSKSVRRILIENDNDNMIDLEIFKSNRFKELQEMKFSSGKINSKQCSQDYFKRVLRNLTKLQFSNNEIDGDIYELFLKNCHNLKHLYVKDVSIGIDKRWLTRIFPKLEHFEIGCDTKDEEVINFLHINQNIKNFSTTFMFLLYNLESIKHRLELNVLSILNNFQGMRQSHIDFFVDKLNTTRSTHPNFFKRLHLYFCLTSKVYYYPSDLLSCVSVFHFGSVTWRHNFSSMINLEQLYLNNYQQIFDFKAARENLKKLKFIEFNYANIINLFELVPGLPSLEVIKVKCATSIQRYSNKMNIIKLDEGRRNTGSRTKLTLYFHEKIYLIIKSALMSSNLKLNLIEIKRYQSYYLPLEHYYDD